MAEKVKFSDAGRVQFPHMPAERLAIVRRRNAERNSITIVWDGTTTPITYASGFIEPVSDSSCPKDSK